MKKKIVLLLMAVMAVMAFSGAALADTINFINTTGSELYALYISDSGTSDWEENLLEGAFMKDQKQLDIEVEGKYEMFDIRVEDEEGNALEFRQIPGDASVVKLNGDGTAEVE